MNGSGTVDVPLMAIVGYRPDDVSSGRYSGVKTQVFPDPVLEMAKSSMSSKTSSSPERMVGDSSKVIIVAKTAVFP